MSGITKACCCVFVKIYHGNIPINTPSRRINKSRSLKSDEHLVPERVSILSYVLYVGFLVIKISLSFLRSAVFFDMEIENVYFLALVLPKSNLEKR